MKKFILASVALIAVFASCKKEDIRTVYKAEPAKATITVEVFDAYLGKNVTSQAEITSNAGTVQGTQVVLVGDQGHFNAIPAQKITISAKYDGREGSATIQIDGVLEDGVAFYNAIVIVGSAIDPTKPIDYDVVAREPGEPKLYQTGYLEYATHSHDGKKWCINNTEFVLFGVTEFDDKNGINEGKSSCTMIDGIDFTDDEKKIAEDYFKKLCKANPEVITKKTINYTVSAFSYYNYRVDYKFTYQYYDVVRRFTLVDGSTKDVSIASIKLTSWSVGGGKMEIASPDHASHYVEGHGVDDPHYSHAHGKGGMNAGGGIVIAD